MRPPTRPGPVPAGGTARPATTLTWAGSAAAPGRPAALGGRSTPWPGSATWSSTTGSSPGTGEVLDHVAAGPPGLLLVTAHPVTRLTRDESGVLSDAGEPFPAEVTALRRRAQQLLEAVIGQLPGWQLACYPAISLVGAADWPAWAGEPAAMLTPAQLSWWASTLPAPLASLHVADLALALTTTCPPATG